MRLSFVKTLVIVWVQAYLLGPELLKLPSLASHFIEHCTEEEDLSFSSFVDLHYANSEHQENGDDDHEQLPYHHHHGATDCCSALVYFTQSTRTLAVRTVALAIAGSLSNEDELLPGHTRGLIQPPRLMA